MKRHIKEYYIPLKASDLGESHKLVLVLTPEQGLIRSAVFGAKGRKGGPKRMLIQPFSLCHGEFYYDPVKKLWRLDEGECLEKRDSYHLHLNRYYAALFWADLIIQSHGGGGSAEFFQLSKEFLKSLDTAEDGEISILFLTYLWRYLAFEGIRPDLSSCSRCGRAAPPDKAVCYSTEGQLVCSVCRMTSLPVLRAEGRRILESDFKQCHSLSADDAGDISSYILSIIRSLFNIRMDLNYLKIIMN